MKVARFNETFPQAELRRLEQVERDAAHRAAETPERFQLGVDNQTLLAQPVDRVLVKTPQEERSRNFEFSDSRVEMNQAKFSNGILEKAKKQDLVLLAEELGQKVSDKMTNIELRNIIIGSKDYEEEFVRDQLSVILEERFERESEEKIARQLAIEEEKIARQHAIQQLRWESDLNELRLEIESIRSNVKRTSCAEDRKKTSSNYRISIGEGRGTCVRETSPAVLMAEATIPVTTLSRKKKGMDDLRVVYVKVKGEQEMVNAVIDTGAQMPVVRPDVVEGQSIDNRGSIQITSAFGEHEMGEVKDSNMELNDFRHGVVPVSKNLVNDRLICSSDYEVLIENSQMIRNSAKLREPSKEEGIISSTDLKSVCSEEVITNLRPETYTQSLLNVPNGDLVAVKINASNVQTNGQGIKESKREVAFTCVFKNRILYSNRRGQPRTREDMWSWSRIRGQQRLCTVMSPNPSATKDSLYKGIAARKYAYPQFFHIGGVEVRRLCEGLLGPHFANENK
ncbi:hypothetical protein TNCV_1719561 [Trichonephila clavipes]|nr:hypothetical protein TNCV_1719561 [Trichonephila clavipes]